MPAIGAFVGQLAFGAIYTGTFASLTAAYYIGSAVAYATNIYLLNTALKALRKRPNTGETRGLEASIVDSTADACIIYGEVRVGGVEMIPRWNSGSDNRYMHQVLVLAAHEIDSFQAFYLDKDTLPTPGSITGSSNDGLISSGTYDGAVWMRGYTGTLTQNVDYILNAAFPTEWPSTARARGFPYIAAQYDWGKGKKFSSYPTLTALVRGAKVYDPRLDSTNGGSGSHRYTDSTTWAYSNNPALCWAHHKMASFGYNVDPATRINWPSVAAAADICDATVDDKDGGSRARYTCNGKLYVRKDGLSSNNRALVDACYGRETDVNGQYHIYAGAWTAPTYSIDKEDWLSIDQIQTVSGEEDGRVNAVHCFYVDPDRNWQRVECNPRKNATYKGDDGGDLFEAEMEQPLCTDESEAQMKAEFLLRASRNAVKIVGKLGPRFMKIKTFDTVSVNFEELGFVSKTFRVAAMTLNMDGSVNVALVEEQEADWDDLVTADYNAISAATIPATNPTTPTEPSDFTVTSLLGTLEFNFVEPAVKPLGTRYQILASPGTLAVAGSYSVIWEGDATKVTMPRDLRVTYWYHGRCTVTSYFSAVYPNTYGIIARPWITAETMPGNRVFPDGELYFASSSYWNGLSDPAASGTAYQDNYYLVGTGGVTPQRGLLVLACDSTFSSDDTLVLLKRFDVNSRGSEYGLPMSPGQTGVAIVQARRATNIASGSTFNVGINAEIYGIRVWTPKSQTIATNSVLKMPVTSWSPNSGDWMTYVGTFTLPTSPQVDSFRFGLSIFRIHGQDTLQIGNAQIATL